jgi:hypothetical protein
VARIFISYRRADSEAHVGRLHDHLLRHFDQSEIFRDIESVQPGEDFESVIKEVVGSCTALIAVIGPRWLDTRDEDGNRRLDDWHDLVRLEIATALKRNIPVIPVLVERATMPTANALPKNLAPLARRNAMDLSQDRFEYDVDRLVHAVGGAYGTMTVSVGSTFFSSRAVSPSLLGSPAFGVFLDNKKVGVVCRGPPKVVKRKPMMDPLLKAPLRGDLTQPLPFVDKRETIRPWLPVVFRTEEGVHELVVRTLTRLKPVPESNRIRFRIKGGQSLSFEIEQKYSPKGPSKLLLKHQRFVVEP